MFIKALLVNHFFSVLFSHMNLFIKTILMATYKFKTLRLFPECMFPECTNLDPVDFPNTIFPNGE